MSGGGASLALTIAALESTRRPRAHASLTLFLAGDVMTGRGIDQILAHSVDPVLYERWIRDARDYVRIAEEESGPIPRAVEPEYIWGDALAELERVAPDARIINLETAVTSGGTPWPAKGIHYRMHPANLPVLIVAGIDVCVLGNNHVLDWGLEGLDQTLATLRDAGLGAPGAGQDLDDAAAPAIVRTGAGRLLVFSYAAPDAGVPPEWAAAPGKPGVHFIDGFGNSRARQVVEHVRRHRRTDDRVVVSLHWGGNWGYEIPRSHRRFAHALIDEGAADVVHGHSSHHAKAIEVYEGRPILYGCGDFINDYEGIGGREEFRSELTAMYFPTLSGDGRLAALTLTPMRVERFRLRRAVEGDARRLAEVLDRESRRFGTHVQLDESERLRVEWS